MSELTDEIFSAFDKINGDLDNADTVKLVVKIITSYWHDQKGLYSKKTIRFLKRKSLNYNILLEDSDNISSKEVIQNIVNLHEVDDGEYEVAMVNQKYCNETGYLEEYNYKLIPYKDSNEHNKKDN